MNKSYLAVGLGVLLGLVLCGAVVLANDLTGASATADCNGYTLTVNAVDLTPGTGYTITYDFTLTCGSNVQDVPGSFGFTAGSASETESTTGEWPGAPLTANCTVSNGSATLTSSGSTVNISINGSGSATLSCGSTTTGKSFSIGPSSMEGDLHISPGDWISGGYNFKFASNSHAATQVTVTATVTVPVVCPDHSVQNVVIPLGQPGVLDGGGVTSWTYNVPAGYSNNIPSNDQNSILVWDGAVQAPVNLCGGQTGRNQTGAVFNVTVSENPQVGLIDWQFHYRDPNAKGKGNVDCTDASNPLRSHADVCGASWSGTRRDP
jgi:hypothetical protein